MRKVALLVSLIAGLFSPAMAQNRMTVTSANIQNAQGTLLASGQACFLPTLIDGTPASFNVPGGGQGTKRAVCTSVTNGAISTSLPNTLLTNPINLCFALTVKDTSNGQTVIDLGYNCLQPSPTAYWCSGSACNLDSFIPSLAPLAPTIAGPIGLTGPQGASTITGMTGDGAGNASLAGKFTAGTVAAGTTIQLGISTFAQLQTAVTSCGLLTCSIFVNGNIPVTSSYTIPPNVVVHLAGGQLQPAAGITLNIFGTIIAPTVQIFGGAGTIAGLTMAHPEWFGSGALCTSGACPFLKPAIDALSTTGGDIFLQNARYRSGYDKNSATDYSSITWLTKPYVHIHGAGRAAYNSGYTQMLNGSVIEGGFYIGGGSASIPHGFNLEHVSIDQGSVVQSAFYSGYTSLDFELSGAQPYVSTHFPNIQGVRITDVNCLGQSSSSPDHCMLVEDVDGAQVTGVQTVYHTHGLALKGTNIAADEVYSRGSSTDCVVLKSDTYSPTVGNYLSNISCAALLTAGDSAGISVYAATAALNDANLSNISVDNTTYGLYLDSDNGLYSVNLSNFVYNGETYTAGTCIYTGGAGAITGVQGSAMQCINAHGISMPTAISSFGFDNVSLRVITGDGIQTNGTGVVSNLNLQTVSGYGVNNTAGTVTLGQVMGSATSGLLHNVYISPTCFNTVCTGLNAFLSNSGTANLSPIMKSVSCTAAAGTCSVTFATPFTSMDHCDPTLTLGAIVAGTAEPTVWVSSATAAAVTFATSSSTFTGSIHGTCWGY